MQAMANEKAGRPVTLVTGGTFGLGQDIVLELARRGHAVVAFGLASRQISSTAEGTLGLQQALEQEGLQAEVLEADVSDAADVARVAQHAMARFGRIDGLVNNAAIGPLGTVLTTEESVFERILDVNVKGVYLMCREVIPHMARQGGGSIVNVGSGAGYGKPNMAAYAASKGALLALSTAMAYDHFHQHVRVNVAIPGGGGIVSGMSVGRYNGDVESFKRRGYPGTVSGMPLDGTEFARTIAFLLSDESKTISGTVVDVGCFANQGGPIPPRPDAAA